MMILRMAVVSLALIMSACNQCEIIDQVSNDPFAYESIPHACYENTSVAFQVLKNSDHIVLAATQNQPPGSLHGMAFRTLMKSDDRLDYFNRLFENGTISGQIYGLAGIYLYDRIKFDKLLPEQRDRVDKVKILASDSIWSVTFGELVVSQSTTKIPMHPKFGQTIKEWENEWDQRDDIDLIEAWPDIVGGALPYYYYSFE